MEKTGWIAVVIALITTGGVIASKYIEVGARRTPPVVDTETTASKMSPQLQLAGNWRDQFGSKFLIDVDGSYLSLSGSNGTKLMSGSGSAKNGTFKLTITNSETPGAIRCVGPVGSAMKQSATCTDPDDIAFEWQLKR